MAVKKTFEFFFSPLLKKFFQDMGRDPNNLEMIILRQKAGQLLKDSNKVIEFPQKESFMKQVELMKKSGDIVDPNNLKKNDNVLTREMFQNSNLNKPTIEGQMEKITGASNRIKEIQKEIDEMYRPKTDAEIKAKYDKQNKESIQKFKDKMKKDESEDKADGGRINFRAGKFVLDKIVAKLLGDPKKVKQAVDDIFPTGDYKYDAQMAADALVENNPRIFKNKLYEDLDLDTQMEIYGAVLGPIQKNMSMAIKMKKASRPEKTLAAMKEGKGIDMSDPAIADEFTRFMKETDPQGSKTIEQTVELANFDPKKVKGNAEGGRIGYYTGGITDIEPDLSDIGHGSDSLMARTRLVSPDGQATTSTGLNYLLAEDNDNIRVPFSTGKLAGGIDSAIEKNKNLEERIVRNKRMTDMLNKMYDERAIKNAPEGVLMDPPPRKNSILSLGEEGTPQDGGAYSLNSDAYSNTIIFDDGTVYYKDTGEYYNDEGQVPGPSKGAKIKPKEMEAAEGGRIGFSAGGGGRRAFLKLLASIGGLTAAAKSGILGLGEGGAKKAVTETVKQSAGNYPPPYFFKLVEKIKFMGDDITEKAATKDREIVKRYKDFEMTEDVATGDIVIKKRNEGSFYDQDGIISDEYIVYKPGQADEMTKGKKPPAEYEEYTVRPDAEGKLRDSEGGLDSIDEILEEVGDTTAMTLKKADGGRIGFSAGGGKFLLSKLGINSTTTRFLEKVFGKEKYKNLIANDPEMHRGLLEVAEMFRSKDKAGLVEYMQNFLPKMSKKELEAFVVGSGDTAGIEGQLIRLGSGRDYKNKIEMIEEANNLRKLKDFDVEDVSKNAEGGRIGFSGGGIYRAIIANSAKKAGMKPYEYIKATSYKSLPPEVKMFMSKADFEKLKMGQEQMYSNYIDMAKTRLNFQKEVEGGKKTPARELFEGMEKTMNEQSYVPKNVNEKDIGEMEIMFRNRFLKDRKPNSSGGLQTMLGE